MGLGHTRGRSAPRPSVPGTGVAAIVDDRRERSRARRQGGTGGWQLRGRAAPDAAGMPRPSPRSVGCAAMADDGAAALAPDGRARSTATTSTRHAQSRQRPIVRQHPERRSGAAAVVRATLRAIDRLLGRAEPACRAATHLDEHERRPVDPGSSGHEVELVPPDLDVAPSTIASPRSHGGRADASASMPGPASCRAGWRAGSSSRAAWRVRHLSRRRTWRVAMPRGARPACRIERPDRRVASAQVEGELLALEQRPDALVAAPVEGRDARARAGPRRGRAWRSPRCAPSRSPGSAAASRAISRSRVTLATIEAQAMAYELRVAVDDRRVRARRAPRSPRS